MSKEGDARARATPPVHLLSMNVQETPSTTDVEIGGIRTRGSFQAGQSETRVPITFKDLKAPRSLLALRPRALPAREAPPMRRLAVFGAH